MVQLESQQSDFVQADINYGTRPLNGEQAYNYISDPPEGKKRSNLEPEIVSLPVTNIRTHEPLTLQRNGFELAAFDHPGAVQWDDEEQIKTTYYNDVEKLLKKVTGGSRVHIFDHTLRRGTIKNSKNLGTQGNARAPVPRAHVDYTLKSGPGRLNEVLPDEAEHLKKTPYAVIQVWRPLKGPVQDSPLGVCDAATVSQSDLLTTKLIFPERTGEVYNCTYNPQHRWYYAKAMQTDEAYVFVCYDSHSDGRPKFTPHTSFDDPTTPPDAPERESIEIRAYVFWENEGADGGVKEN